MGERAALIHSRGRASLLDAALLLRHQSAAFAATAVDFVAMIALVEAAAASPPVATLFSAAAGAIANFTLSRTWTFAGRHDACLIAQASRYAVVALGGALLNAALLAIILAAGLRSYALARAVAAILVSVAYSYPLHTRFVFRVTE